MLLSRFECPQNPQRQPFLLRRSVSVKSWHFPLAHTWTNALRRVNIRRNSYLLSSCGKQHKKAYLNTLNWQGNVLSLQEIYKPELRLDTIIHTLTREHFRSFLRYRKLWTFSTMFNSWDETQPLHGRMFFNPKPRKPHARRKVVAWREIHHRLQNESRKINQFSIQGFIVRGCFENFY